MDPNKDTITIRSWPKVIFLYPVMVSAFLCGTIQALTEKGIDSQTAETAGLFFLVVLSINVLVISFEFSRFKTVAILFGLIAVLFILLYISTKWEVFQFLRDLFAHFHIKLSTSFYFALGSYFVVVFLAVFVATRFDYWQIKSNEILHKEGFLGDVRRFPSPNLKMTKEINDVFEFLLMGAGRIVLYPASEKQAIVLNHVLRVNKAEQRIQELLSSLSVEITGHEHDDSARGIGVGD